MEIPKPSRHIDKVMECIDDLLGPPSDRPEAELEEGMDLMYAHCTPDEQDEIMTYEAALYDDVVAGRFTKNMYCRAIRGLINRTLTGPIPEQKQIDPNQLEFPLTEL